MVKTNTFIIVHMFALVHIGLPSMRGSCLPSSQHINILPLYGIELAIMTLRILSNTAKYSAESMLISSKTNTYHNLVISNHKIAAKFCFPDHAQIRILLFFTVYGRFFLLVFMMIIAYLKYSYFILNFILFI